MIRIDPNELSSSAANLRSCAVEIAEIGSQLASCVCCPLPPSTAPLVDEFIGTVDRDLDSIAVKLDAEANSLSNRAALASTDLVTASRPIAPLAAGATAGYSIMTLGGGGPQFSSTASPLGSPPTSSMTVGGGSSGAVAVGPASPGNVSFGGSNPGYTLVANPLGFSPTSTVSVGGMVGPHIANSTSPGASAAFNVSQKVNASLDGNTNLLFAKTKGSVELDLGRVLSNGEYHDLVPEAAPRPAPSLLF